MSAHLSMDRRFSSGTVPAWVPSAHRGFFGRIGHALAHAWHWLTSEDPILHEYRYLSRQDDHFLADIGLTRSGLWQQLSRKTRR